jgi:hypothetical protein
MGRSYDEVESYSFLLSIDNGERESSDGNDIFDIFEKRLSLFYFN